MSDQQKMVKAFNEWMRRYIEEPERFEAEFKSVIEFLKQESDGAEPDYGTECAAYLAKLMDEVAA